MKKIIIIFFGLIVFLSSCTNHDRKIEYSTLENNVENAIDKVKSENYKNYFEHAYGLDESVEFIRKPSTRKRKLKSYK